MEVKKKNLKKVVQKRVKRTAKQKLNKEEALRLIDNIKGAGTGIWKEDAQEYVNKVRGNDRF